MRIDRNCAIAALFSSCAVVTDMLEGWSWRDKTHHSTNSLGHIAHEFCGRRGCERSGWSPLRCLFNNA